MSSREQTPFVSEQAEYIFYLTWLDGPQRARALAITEDHYEDPEVAKRWYELIKTKIQNGNRNCSEALTKLDNLYEIMTDRL